MSEESADRPEGEGRNADGRRQTAARALLGHATEEMTRRYVHDDVEKIQQIANDRNEEISE
jgi:hypothetical protein